MSKKLNDGCLKIFLFLKLLYADEAYYDKVLEIFKDEIKDMTTNYHQVCLNKYINTLKVFGIKIKKEKLKYTLVNSVYNMDISPSDLKSLGILANSLSGFSDKLQNGAKGFLKEIEFRLNNKDKNTLNSLYGNSEYDFSFYYSNLREQIAECERICSENYMINLVYLKNNKEKNCKCTPKEVIYDCKDAYLLVHDTMKHVNLEVPVSSILSIMKLPQMSGSVEFNTTVVFKLKNRLAKIYRLKEGETSKGLNDNGELIVVNNKECRDKLMHRLLRYTYNCEVVSPKDFRDEMIKLLGETLDNYKNEE